MGGRGSNSASMKVYSLGTKQGGEKFIEAAKARADKLESASNPTDLVNARKNAEIFIGNADKRIRRIDSEMAPLKKEMERYARDAAGYPSKVPGTTKEGYQRYRAAQKEYSKLLFARGSALEGKSIVNGALTRKEQQRQKKTFVNSYGEATPRYITSPSYERARKREDKAVLRNMGY